MMNTTIRGVRWGLRTVTMVVLGTGSAVAQSSACEANAVTWSGIGVGAFHCPGGDCEFGEDRYEFVFAFGADSLARLLPTRTDDLNLGSVSSFDFSTEPILRAIDPDGPAAGLLQEGDVLLAVDGTVVTSARGGRNLANLSLDRTATLTIRRDDEIRQVDVRPRARCGPPVLLVSEYALTVRPLVAWDTMRTHVLWNPEGRRIEVKNLADSVWTADTDSVNTRWRVVGSLSRTPSDSVQSWGTIASDSLAGGVWSADEANRWRYAVAFDSLVEGRVDRTVVSGPMTSTGVTEIVSQSGLGIGVRCEELCVMRWDARGRTQLVLKGRVTIGSVTRDGPADRAGLAPGDELVEIDGVRVDSDEAWIPIGEMLRGRNVAVLYRRDGQERETTVRLRREDR